jgi:DNA repair exonuclease SbcCD nuclease subunit
MVPEKIAILCSDIHLSDKPPIARSDEPDWYEAMARPLQELRDLAGDLPVFCGGDVFDRWSSCPRLINFAMRELPLSFWSVMGQHDMPYHNWEERRSSAFWTLVEADRVGFGDVLEGLDKGRFGWLGMNLAYAGFNWGEEILPLDEFPRGKLEGVKVCIAHKYCWIGAARESSIATDRNSLDSCSANLKGYDVVLFGDNHKGFLVHEKKRGTVFNAGTFMRRASDEIDYRPMVGILYEDGTVEPHYLDTSREVMSGDTAVRSAEKMIVNIEGFVEELRNMQDSGLKFQTAIERALEERGAGKSVRRIILEAMEGK